MDLTPGTMLLTTETTSMYKNIQTRPALNQIAQNFNGNKTKYQHLPVDDILRSFFLIMINNIFRFIDSHWIQLKVIAMGTPLAPIYNTVFCSVFELFLFEIFGNNLLLYRQFIDNLLVLYKIYN